MGAVMAAGQDERGGVVFDVDGTLLDNNYVHVVAWWEAFRERGYDVPCADIHQAIGLSAADLVQRVLGRAEQSVVEAHGRYVAPYLGRMRALPGAGELLEATAALGLRVMLATSAKEEEVGLMLHAIGTRGPLAAVVSSGDVERAKPQPDIVNAALGESGTSAARAVMVGDTVWDVIAARRANVPCIGVRTGGICERQLLEAGAVAVYADPAALLGELPSSAIGRLAAPQPGSRV
jgi:phosphoglycolate phosphatase-like HAD superfamily hydrolase